MHTRPGDLVLIHHKDQPAVYARVEGIGADLKPGWWQCRLLILQVPAREVTWILREEYIDGGEFTMGGEKMRLEPVPPPREEAPPEPVPPRPPAGKGEKVVDLFSRKK